MATASTKAAIALPATVQAAGRRIHDVRRSKSPGSTGGSACNNCRRDAGSLSNSRNACSSASALNNSWLVREAVNRSSRSRSVRVSVANPPSRFWISSSFMTALPTASHQLQKPLAATRIPGIDRIDGVRAQHSLNLRECLALQLQPEQVPAAAAQLPDGGGKPLGHLLPLQASDRIEPH